MGRGCIVAGADFLVVRNRLIKILREAMTDGLTAMLPARSFLTGAKAVTPRRSDKEHIRYHERHVQKDY